MVCLKELRFSGYRSFPGPLFEESRNLLSVAPLTLVIGRNGAGKSQVLRLLHQIIAGLAGVPGPWLPNQSGPYTFATNVEDNFYFRSPAHPLKVYLSWEFRGHPGSLDATFVAPQPAETEKRVTLLQFTLMQGAERVEGEDSSVPWNRSPWAELRAAFVALWRGSTALGGTRGRIERSYPIPQGRRERMHASGEGAAEWLYHSERLRLATRDWVSTPLTPLRLDLDSSGGELRLLDRSGPNQVNLSDAAEGVQQLLPVITLLQSRCLEPISGVDCIEQPELHLHDAVHGDVGDLLLRAAGILPTQPGAKLRPDGGYRLLVETHSEGLLLRVRRRIAEGEVDPAHVALAFVEREGVQSHLRPIPLDRDGQPTWWPEGVFLERYREVQAINRAIHKKAG